MIETSGVILSGNSPGRWAFHFLGDRPQNISGLAVVQVVTLVIANSYFKQLKFFSTLNAVW